MMVGAEIGEVKAAAGRATGAAAARRAATSRSSRTIRTAYGSKAISLEVQGGEILGIAGVAGNGQDELFAALSGERLSPEAGNRGRSTASAVGTCRSPSGAGSARPSCRRSGSATAPRRA